MDTWEQAAADVAARIYLGDIFDGSTDGIATLDGVDTALNMGELITVEDLADIAYFAMEIIGERRQADVYSDIYDEIVDTIIAKQHDYGHGNILRHGIFGVVVRMCDKVARIRNLERLQRDPANESLTDSWADLVGYAIVGIMLLEGTFELPLERDLPQPQMNVVWHTPVRARYRNMHGKKVENIITPNHSDLVAKVYDLLQFSDVQSVKFNFLHGEPVRYDLVGN